jgi:hypothetical protein
MALQFMEGTRYLDANMLSIAVETWDASTWSAILGRVVQIVMRLNTKTLWRLIGEHAMQRL